MSNNLDKTVYTQIEKIDQKDNKDYTPNHRKYLIDHLKKFEDKLNKLMFERKVDGVTVEFNKDDIHYYINEYTLRIIIRETVETNSLEDVYWPFIVFDHATFKGSWGGLVDNANNDNDRTDLTNFIGGILKGKYNYDAKSLTAYLEKDKTFVNEDRDKYIVRQGKKRLGLLWDFSALKNNNSDSILKWLNKSNPKLKGKQKKIIFKFKITRQQFQEMHKAVHSSYYERLAKNTMKIAGANIDNSIYLGDRLYTGSRRHSGDYWFDVVALICLCAFCLGAFIFALL
jgi:hypothetical protein